MKPLESVYIYTYIHEPQNRRGESTSGRERNAQIFAAAQVCIFRCPFLFLKNRVVSSKRLLQACRPPAMAPAPVSADHLRELLGGQREARRWIILDCKQNGAIARHLCLRNPGPEEKGPSSLTADAAGPDAGGAWLPALRWDADGDAVLRFALSECGSSSEQSSHLRAKALPSPAPARLCLCQPASGQPRNRNGMFSSCSIKRKKYLKMHFY